MSVAGGCFPETLYPSAALPFVTASFLSLSLNLNCNRSTLSQGTRVKGHGGILGRISQMSTLHFLPLFLACRCLPSLLSPRGLPPCQWALTAAHLCRSHQCFLGQREGACRAGCFSPTSYRRSWGQGCTHSFIHSFTHSKELMNASHAVNTCS